MFNTTYNSTEDKINKLQSLKGKAKLENYKTLSDYYDEMKVRNCNFEEDPFSKNVQGVGKIYHEILLSMKVLHTKPQIRNMKIIQNDF